MGILNLFKKKALPPPPPPPSIGGMGRMTSATVPPSPPSMSFAQSEPSIPRVEIPEPPSIDRINVVEQRAPYESISPPGEQPLEMPGLQESEELEASEESESPESQVKPSHAPVSSGKTVFVSSNDYQQMQQSINTVKNVLIESGNLMSRLNDLKSQQEKSLEEWRSHLADIEKKLAYVDNVVFKEGESHA